MINKKIGNVNVFFPEELSKTEILYAIGKVSAIKPKSDLSEMVIKFDEKNNLVIDYKFQEPKFERIRRITGYLVGTTDRWNNAKKAELKDRLVHLKK